MTRFIIAVDIEGEDVIKDYQVLHDKMTNSGLEWESTDEAYTDDGDQIVEEAIEEARMARITAESGGPPHDAATATGMYDRDDG